MKSTNVFVKSSRYSHSNRIQSDLLFQAQSGFSLIQMAVTMAVVGVLFAIALPSISFGVNPLTDTSNRVKNQIKLARVKALSTTTAYRVKPLANNKIEIQSYVAQNGALLSTCANAAVDVDGDGNPQWQRLAGYGDEDFTFEKGVELTGVVVNGTTVADITDWQLCFNSRGLSNQSVDLEFTEINTGAMLNLSILMGGSIRVSQS